MRPLAKMLKAARQKARLTQLEVSKVLGYRSPQYLSNCERSIADPSPLMLKQLIKLYDLDKNAIVLLMTEHYEKELRRKLK